MDKNELAEIKKISKEINVLREKIQELYNGDDYGNGINMATDKVKGSSAHFPYGARSFTIQGMQEMSRECIEKRDLLAKRLSEKMGMLCDKLNKFYGYTDSIPDGEIRLMLIYKYVDGKTEEQIAEELHMSRSTVQRKFKDWSTKYAD